MPRVVGALHDEAVEQHDALAVRRLVSERTILEERLAGLRPVHRRDVQIFREFGQAHAIAARGVHHRVFEQFALFLGGVDAEPHSVKVADHLELQAQRKEERARIGVVEPAHERFELAVAARDAESETSHAVALQRAFEIVKEVSKVVHAVWEHLKQSKHRAPLLVVGVRIVDRCPRAEDRHKTGDQFDLDISRHCPLTCDLRSGRASRASTAALR